MPDIIHLRKQFIIINYSEPESPLNYLSYFVIKYSGTNSVYDKIRIISLMRTPLSEK